MDRPPSSHIYFGRGKPPPHEYKWFNVDEDLRDGFPYGKMVPYVATEDETILCETYLSNISHYKRMHIVVHENERHSPLVDLVLPNADFALIELKKGWILNVASAGKILYHRVIHTKDST